MLVGSRGLVEFLVHAVSALSTKLMLSLLLRDLSLWWFYVQHMRSWHGAGPRERGRGGLSYSTSCSSSTFIPLWGGQGLDQHGRLPCCAVVRYNVPVFRVGVAGDRRDVLAVLVKPVADLGIGGHCSDP